MKSIYTIALLLLTIAINAQNGLEGIIVEKYYISDGNDAMDDTGGKVPEGATTYRIYVDMKPGYIFQAAYGVETHKLRISTTEKFFNNEDRGSKFPTYTKNQAASNTVMLDSWLSVGAACAANYGVLKTDDNGIATVVNKDGLLKNNDPAIGISLTQQDGMITGTPENVTTVGLDNQIALFDNTNDAPAPNEFLTTNGAWASLNGSKGADSLTNRVLIAQVTTAGVLTFELNIQIRSKEGIGEQYVASNPTGSEIFEPTLTYSSLMSGIEGEQIKENYFSVYPNPTTGSVYFKIPAVGNEMRYTLNTMQGRQVTSGRLYGNNQNIDLSLFDSGLYIMTIKIDDKVSYHKIYKI